MADREVYVVTGARKGIGRELAMHFLRQGKRVVGCSRAPATGMPEGYEHHCLDVADERAVQQMFREIRQQHGRLDVLINNAGAAAMNHVLLTPLATARRLLETNVLGTFLFCREAARLMQARRSGRIVNFTSVAARLALEGEALYAASKAAVENLTRTLARELGPFGITVNAVGPTAVRTDLIAGVPEEKLAALLQRQALPRMAEISDVVNAVEFFLRPASDLVTGQVLYLGGV